MFRTYMNKGFHIKFSNGITLSVQFGPGNYCEKQNSMDYEKPKKVDRWESENAEIAIWAEGGTWITKECLKELYPEEEYLNDVKGYVTADEVADIIQWCKNKEVS